VVAEVIETLPPPMRGEHAADVESTLVELAAEYDPRSSKQLGQRILAHLDPDGAAPAERTQSALRGLTLRPGPDDLIRIEGLLTPACAAVWQAGHMLLDTGNLPQQAGLPRQLIVTVDLADLERRLGQATTHHGGTLSIREAATGR